MENVFFTSEPIIALILTIITVSLITIGRTMQIPHMPLIAVVYSLILLIYHTVGVNNALEVTTTPYYFSITIDLIMLFLGFISYLWIDDMVAKLRNKKSYGDALSWFWDKL